MILLKVKAYIKARQKVTLQDICYHFDLNRSTAQAIIERLVAQGNVQKLEGSQCSSSQCHSHCQQQDTWLLWLENKYPPIKISLQTSLQ